MLVLVAMEYPAMLRGMLTRTIIIGIKNFGFIHIVVICTIISPLEVNAGACMPVLGLI